mgnify:CR=1 FL=1
MNVSNSADAENIDPAMSAEKQAPGTPPRAMTAEEADAETPVMSAEAADAETPEPATPEPATTTTPATLDALHNYLGPLCQALLGATPEALRRADASNIEWFAGQPAGSTIVCTTDDDGNVTYHRGRSRSGAARQSAPPSFPVLPLASISTCVFEVALNARRNTHKGIHQTLGAASAAKAQAEAAAADKAKAEKARAAKAAAKARAEEKAAVAAREASISFAICAFKSSSQVPSSSLRRLRLSSQRAAVIESGAIGY